MKISNIIPFQDIICQPKPLCKKMANHTLKHNSYLHFFRLCLIFCWCLLLLLFNMWFLLIHLHLLKNRSHQILKLGNTSERLSNLHDTLAKSHDVEFLLITNNQTTQTQIPAITHMLHLEHESFPLWISVTTSVQWK